MARTQYFVENHKSEWKISLDAKRYGPYATQAKPIRATVDAAHGEGKKNPDGAQVLVQGRDRKFRTEWTYGKDPYPPAG